MRRAIPLQAIAGARRTLGSLMTDHCTVHRPQTERVGAATRRVLVDGTDPVVATDVPCRVELIDQMPSAQFMMQERETFNDGTHNVFFLHDQDVQEGDWIELPGDADNLEIVGVSNRQTDGFLLQANAKEHG